MAAAVAVAEEPTEELAEKSAEDLVARPSEEETPGQMVAIPVRPAQAEGV